MRRVEPRPPSRARTVRIQPDLAGAYLSRRALNPVHLMDGTLGGCTRYQEPRSKSCNFGCGTAAEFTPRLDAPVSKSSTPVARRTASTTVEYVRNSTDPLESTPCSSRKVVASSTLSWRMAGIRETEAVDSKCVAQRTLKVPCHTTDAQNPD